jgi:hypothetical protein
MVRKQTPFRCVAQKGWYFVVCEGRIGPFETRRQAEAEYQDYMRQLTGQRQPNQTIKKVSLRYRGNS